MNFFGENMNWVFSEINLNGKISPSIPMIIISLSMIFVILHRQIKNGFCYSPGTKKKIGRKLNKEKEKRQKHVNQSPDNTCQIRRNDEQRETI